MSKTHQIQHQLTCRVGLFRLWRIRNDSRWPAM